MGVLSSLQKRRARTRQDIKAAQARARQEVKESAKTLERREKLLSREEKRLLKAEEKGLKKKRQHELKLAKEEYKKIKEGKINRNNAKRLTQAGRVALPVLLPLVYRGLTQLRNSAVEARAKRAGVTPEELAQFSGHGADLQARIQGIRKSLDGTNLPGGFKQDIEERLKSLRSATDNAEFMTPDQRRRAHGAINSDIDKVTAEIQDRLTRG